MDAFSEFAELIRTEVGLAESETLRLVNCDPNDQSEFPDKSFEIISVLPPDMEMIEAVEGELFEKVVESEVRYLNDSQVAALVEVSTKILGASFG